MDSAQWTQEFGVSKSMAEAACPMGSACARPETMEKKVTRPPKDQALNCPRCHSANTKFCYYNNYSLTQPRYFCKGCRRYWTEGGTLRNVPVGGGSRRNKKSFPNPSCPISFSAAAADQLPFSSQKLVLPDLNPPSIPYFPTHHQNPRILDHGRDLNLGFQASHDYGHALPQFQGSSLSGPLSALSFIRNGDVLSRGVNTFFPGVALDQTSSSALYEQGFLFQECKPKLTFSIDGAANGGGYVSSKSAMEENADGSLMFTLGETKRSSSTTEGGHHNQDKGSNENNSNGFWNGMLGGGSW